MPNPQNQKHSTIRRPMPKPALRTEICSKVAREVLLHSNREHPADQVLHETLANRSGLNKAERQEICRQVFAYYRWLGWLDAHAPLEQQINRALNLAARFKNDPNSFTADELQRAVPSWICSYVSTTEAWLRSLQAEPRLWLRARKGTGQKLARLLGNCTPAGDGALSDTLEYRGELDLYRTPEFHAGAFEIQDISSQIVGFVCNPRPGETWWDACAGEGGKTLHLSDLMNNQGLIWASDRIPWRLNKLKLRARRAGVFNYRAVVWNGGPRPPTRTMFDGVLVDAPCSGVGTWQRHPHARWTTSPEDVQELVSVQKHLLNVASSAVKPGGRLVYAVCTLTNAETSDVAKDFSARHPEFEPEPVINPILPQTPPSAELLLWPQEIGGNGMFIAHWRRKNPKPA